MQEKKMQYLKWIAVAATVAIVISATCYAALADRRTARLEQQYAAQQEAAYGELIQGIASLEGKLYKLSLMPNSAQTPGLLADIWRQTGELNGYLSALNLGEDIDQAIFSFLNQAGDYAKQLFLHSAGGGTLEQEDAGQILKLQGACAQLEQNLEGAWQAGYAADGVLVSFFPADSGYTENFSAQEYPRLIYDGPFSESLESAPALKNAAKVSQEQAQQLAEEFAGESLEFVSYNKEAKVPFFSFAGQSGTAISVAEQGGGILSWSVPRQTDISIQPTEQRAEELKQVGLEFLKQKGYPDAELSYAQYYGGDALLNFVPLQDGVRLYPDLIKLWIRADEMQVVGMDAWAYVKNHKQRSFAQGISLAEARAQLPAAAKETDCAMAVIPKETGEEIYCCEFFCDYADRQAILYLDAADGSVEDILEIVHVNDGVLTR